MACGHLLGDFGVGAGAIAQLQQLVFRTAISIVGICFLVLDDVAGLARHGLLADPQIVAQLGTPQSFSQDAGDLQAGRAKSHSGGVTVSDCCSRLNFRARLLLRPSLAANLQCSPRSIAPARHNYRSRRQSSDSPSRYARSMCAPVPRPVTIPPLRRSSAASRQTTPAPETAPAAAPAG